jgi:hypothetical protein
MAYIRDSWSGSSAGEMQAAMAAFPACAFHEVTASAVATDVASRTKPRLEAKTLRVITSSIHIGEVGGDVPPLHLRLEYRQRVLERGAPRSRTLRNTDVASRAKPRLEAKTYRS